MMEYLFAKPYTQTITRIQSFVEQCHFDRQGLQNAKLNLMSLSSREWGDRSNMQVAEEVSNMLHRVHGEVSWQVVVANHAVSSPREVQLKKHPQYVNQHQLSFFSKH